MKKTTVPVQEQEEEMAYYHLFVSGIYVGTARQSLIDVLMQHMSCSGLHSEISPAYSFECNLNTDNFNIALEQCRTHYRQGMQKGAVVNAVNDNNEVVTVKANSAGLLYV